MISQRLFGGTVVNAVTNQPVGRALVYSPDNRYATFTDGEGISNLICPRSKAKSPLIVSMAHRAQAGFPG